MIVQPLTIGMHDVTRWLDGCLSNRFAFSDGSHACSGRHHLLRELLMMRPAAVFSARVTRHRNEPDPKPFHWACEQLTAIWKSGLVRQSQGNWQSERQRLKWSIGSICAGWHFAVPSFWLMTQAVPREPIDLTLEPCNGFPWMQRPSVVFMSCQLLACDKILLLRVTW